LAVWFSPNGSLLASASRDDTIRLWDMNVAESSRKDPLLCHRPEPSLPPALMDSSKSGKRTQTSSWGYYPVESPAQHLPPSTYSLVSCTIDSSAPANGLSQMSLFVLIADRSYLATMNAMSNRGTCTAAPECGNQTSMGGSEMFVRRFLHRMTWSRGWNRKRLAFWILSPQRSCFQLASKFFAISMMSFLVCGRDTPADGDWPFGHSVRLGRGIGEVNQAGPPALRVQ